MVQKWFTTDLEKVQSLILEAKELMETIRDTQQEKFDNLPEGFQMGTKGKAMEERIGYFEEVCDSLESAEEAISNVMEV
ncbi:MAG: hypothetical protein WC477_05215 [Patescibacteria group bacterium]